MRSEKSGRSRRGGQPRAVRDDRSRLRPAMESRTSADSALGCARVRRARSRDRRRAVAAGRAPRLRRESTPAGWTSRSWCSFRTSSIASRWRSTQRSVRSPRSSTSLTSALVAATFALPHLPASGDSWPWWFVAYVIAFAVHWSVLLLIVAVRLWRAGRKEAAVARRRMRDARDRRNRDRRRARARGGGRRRGLVAGARDRAACHVQRRCVRARFRATRGSPAPLAEARAAADATGNRRVDVGNERARRRRTSAAVDGRHGRRPRHRAGRSRRIANRRARLGRRDCRTAR